jgi:hypothetical protein
MAAGRLHPDHRPPEMARSGDERRGQFARSDQFGLAIDIGQQPLEQIGTLRDAVSDIAPLVLADQQRQCRERPGPLVRIAGQAEGGADLVDLAADPVLQPLQPALGQRGDAVEQMVPPASAPAHVATHDIAGAGLRDIGFEPTLPPGRQTWQLGHVGPPRHG